MGLFKKKKEEVQYEYIESTLEENFEEYINNFYQLKNDSEKGEDVIFDTYHALITMGNGIGIENGEGQRQQKLIDKIGNGKGKFEYILGRSKNTPNKIHFCQVSTYGYSIDEDKKEVEKLYVNCDRDKVSMIIQQLMKKTKKHKVNLSMKFAYEDQISKNYLRNDKIVIYTEDDIQKSSMIDILKEIQSENPELFNPKNQIPFMPKINGARYISSAGKQKKGRYCIYKDFSGELTKSVINTYNNVLAEALQEAFVISTELTCKSFYSIRDEKTNNIVAPEDKIKECLNNYMNQNIEERQKIISAMKYVFEELCEKNNINIYSILLSQMNLQLRKSVKNKNEIKESEVEYKFQSNKDKDKDIETHVNTLY